MKPILVFQTDFTYKEGAVCAMYGVVKTVDRELEIFDGTHEIPQYDIQSASYHSADTCFSTGISMAYNFTIFFYEHMNSFFSFNSA